MKPYLLLITLSLKGSVEEPWPVGKRAEAYLASRTGLQRTEASPGYSARTRLSDLLADYALPAQLTPATALSLHYASTEAWGEVRVYAYTFARSTALDSTYRLLATQVSAPAKEAEYGRQQRAVRTLYVARSHYYLLLFDGSRLTRDLSEFLPLADIYADLLDD